MTQNTSASRTKRLRTMFDHWTRDEIIEETNERLHDIDVLMIALGDPAGADAPLDERGAISTRGADGVEQRARIPGCYDPAKLFAVDRAGEVGLALRDRDQRTAGRKDVVHPAWHRD